MGPESRCIDVVGLAIKRTLVATRKPHQRVTPLVTCKLTSANYFNRILMKKGHNSDIYLDTN